MAKSQISDSGHLDDVGCQILPQYDHLASFHSTSMLYSSLSDISRLDTSCIVHKQLPQMQCRVIFTEIHPNPTENAHSVLHGL